MASIHKTPSRPNWFAMFRDSTGRQHCISTRTPDRRVALKVAAALSKANELATAQNLSPDRARKLIDDTLADLLEGHTRGLSTEALAAFFETAAKLARRGEAPRDYFRDLVSKSIGGVIAITGHGLPSMSVRDWCKRWLELKALEAEPRTHERYETSLRRFLAFLGAKADKDLGAVRTDDVIRLRDDTATRLSVTSTNMDLKVIRACFYAAMKQDLLDKNVASMVDALKQRGESARRAFTLEEVRKVLAQCDAAGGEWCGLVLTAVYTGQRLGDIAGLTWVQLDLAKAEISFVTRKTGKRLSMKLAKPLQDYFETIPSADDPGAYVFPTAAALAEKHTGTVSTKFYDEILVPAGLVPVRPKNHARITKRGRDARRQQSELSFHSFRHTLTSWLKSAGASNALAQMIVGHDSAVVSRNYTHLAAADTAEPIARLPDVTKTADGNPWRSS